jgi:hypothetical protein
MPNALSSASPALFWAWLRYYLAPTSSEDLRISMDFSDLDPHQKGILSDDFGVAISTQWLSDRFGGFKEIVDGRRFILQFSRLLRRKYEPTAKVGPSKTPDFVMLDHNRKWHVLECKGTQTKEYQKQSLKVAIAQKRALSILGGIRGERLAAALFIGNENQPSSTDLRVIDPEDDEPLLELSDNQSDEMQNGARRIAIARAFGTIGLNEIAMELSLPPDVDPDSELLRPSETTRIQSSRDARRTRATEQARERRLVGFEFGSRRYEGREVRYQMPPTATHLPFSTVTVRQGVLQELVQELSTPGALADDALDRSLDVAGASTGVRSDADDSHLMLNYGSFMCSEMTWD